MDELLNWESLDDKDEGVEVQFLDYSRLSDGAELANPLKTIDEEIADIERRMRELDHRDPGQPRISGQDVAQLLKQAVEYALDRLGEEEFSDIRRFAGALVASQWLIVVRWMLEQPAVIESLGAAEGLESQIIASQKWGLSQLLEAFRQLRQSAESAQGGR